MDKNSPKEKTIVEAARNRFAHYGFSKVTMEEIATDVGMGKASLYYYFPKKEDLFKKLVYRNSLNMEAPTHNVLIYSKTYQPKAFLNNFQQLLKNVEVRQ